VKSVKGDPWGEFHKAIYALRLKFALSAHPFCTNLPEYGIKHLRTCAQLIAFSPKFECTLRFTPCAKLL
jgi:hypothetical protein